MIFTIFWLKPKRFIIFHEIYGTKKHNAPQTNVKTVIEVAWITGLSLLEKAGKVSINIPFGLSASYIWTDLTFAGKGCNGSLSPEASHIK